MSTQAKCRAAITTIHIASSSATQVLWGLIGPKPTTSVRQGMRHCRRQLTIASTTSFRSSYVLMCKVQSGLTLTLAMLTTLSTGTGSTDRRQVLINVISNNSGNVVVASQVWFFAAIYGASLWLCASYKRNIGLIKITVRKQKTETGLDHAVL